MQVGEGIPARIGADVRAVARHLVAVDAAGGAQSGAVVTAHGCERGIEQHDLAHHRSQVELIALHLEGLRIGDGVLVELVHLAFEFSVRIVEATPARTVPRHHERAVDHDAVAEGIESQFDTNFVGGDKPLIGDIELSEGARGGELTFRPWSPDQIDHVDEQRVCHVDQG